MTTRTVPLLAATALSLATATAAVVPAGAAVPKPKKCGSVVTNSGAKVKYINAQRTSCKTAKAIAKLAKGQNSYKSYGFVCRRTGPTYACFKSKNKQAVVFTYYKKKK